jgi:HK97 family phage prohead protease
VSRVIEQRAFTATCELRAKGDTLTLEGYASTFSQPYDMDFYEETVDPGAFTRTLAAKPDVRLLINHDGLPLARTTSGTLKLATDTVGLHVAADLNAKDPDVLRLAPKMERGDLNEMSFGFRTIKDEWDEEYTKRTLLELKLDQGDVSVVTYPANPNTTAGIRSLLGARLGLPKGLPFGQILLDLRAGKAISAANVELLQRVLDTLAVIDGHIDLADADIDKAQADLAALLKVNDPDPPDPPADKDVLSAPVVPVKLIAAQAARRAALARKL